ncbi:hypothetical protein BDZ89DRAFT_573029 [Hymenopellis radicata]|nr:hypothetical protein BDZ89DRAFT_573029 [Hymenopellis radicata]
MSQPPAYGEQPPVNPDSRPLPPGWVTQYDANYKTWFYVNTHANPPTPSWTHPLGPPPPPPSQFTPPSGPPPPDNRGYGQNQGYGKIGGGGGGGGGGGYGQPGYGGGGYGGGYQQQPQVMYAQQPPKKSGGIGMGGALALGAGGLIGGALLADAINDHEEDAYQDGEQ